MKQDDISRRRFVISRGFTAAALGVLPRYLWRWKASVATQCQCVFTRFLTDKTIVIPGHCPVGGKIEMTEYRNMLAAIRERVAALKGEGKSLDDIVAAKPTASYDAKWGTGFVNGELFTKLVCNGVGKDPAYLHNSS